MAAKPREKKASVDDVLDFIFRIRKWWREQLTPVERRILRETIFRP